MHTIKVKNQKMILNLGEKLSSSGATSIVYNVTDTNDFVCKLYRKKSYAKTIHKKLIHFEKNPPSEELAAIEVLGSTYHQLAWPKQVVYEDDKPVGFIMPKINFDLAVPLNKIFSVKNRKSAGFVEDIRWRILVCRNLAAIYKELHSKNYFVVDTKPANILTYKKIQGVCLLDCDNFKLAGTDFNADMMTPEYTAPESMNMSKEKLGREQDIFAISVLFFQLLNNGIHPYQGVPKTAATLDIRARIMKNAYAYGEQKSKVQGPSPVSIHHLFPKPLHDMFERIFAKNERPEASEWVQVFDELKKAEHLSKCSKINHQGFKKGCPTCEFEKIVAKGTKKSVAKTNNSKNNSTSTPQNQTSTTSNTAKSSPNPWSASQSNRNFSSSPSSTQSSPSAWYYVGVFFLANFLTNIAMLIFEEIYVELFPFSVENFVMWLTIMFIGDYIIIIVTFIALYSYFEKIIISKVIFWIWVGSILTAGRTWNNLKIVYLELGEPVPDFMILLVLAVTICYPIAFSKYFKDNKPHRFY